MLMWSTKALQGRVHNIFKGKKHGQACNVKHRKRERREYHVI